MMMMMVMMMMMMMLIRRRRRSLRPTHTLNLQHFFSFRFYGFAVCLFIDVMTHDRFFFSSIASATVTSY